MYNPFSLEDKIVLVTGASSGIGRGIAVACSKMGAKVIINGRNQERLNETFNLLENEGHQQIVADLAVQDGIDELVNRCPSINGYVHSAGIPQLCAVRNIKRQDINEILNVNTVSPILMVASLTKKKKILKNSSIVLISSMSGVCIGNIGEASYSATKGALNGYIKSAAIELAVHKTRINSICPGLVPTRILELSNSVFSGEQLKETMYSRYPLKRVGTPEDIANGAIYLLSDASSWVTGINLLIDGGYTIV